MALNDDTLVEIVNQNEELIAKSDTLYDALTHVYAVAKKGRLPDGEAREALARIMEIVSATKNALDDMLNAGLMRGLHYELLDEEAMEWYAIAEHQFMMLSPEGKRRYVAARKRASAREEKSLREHGADLLALNHDAARNGLALITPDEQDDN